MILYEKRNFIFKNIIIIFIFNGQYITFIFMKKAPPPQQQQQITQYIFLFYRYRCEASIKSVKLVRKLTTKTGK